MPNLLCLNTAFDYLQVGLSHGDLYYVREVNTPKQHAAQLIGLIQSLLQEAKIEAAQLDAIAYNAGPASFTGIRMGAGVAMSMGYALQKPVLTLSALTLLAASASKTGGIAIATNAYQGEVYFARFEKQDAVTQTQTDSLVLPHEILPLLQDNDHLFTDCLSLYHTTWEGALTAHHIVTEHLPTVNMRAFLEMSESAFAKGEGKVALQAGPLYLRKEDSWQAAK